MKKRCATCKFLKKIAFGLEICSLPEPTRIVWKNINDNVKGKFLYNKCPYYGEREKDENKDKNN